MDKDLQITHAEIEDKHGRSVHVPNNIRDCTSEELDGKVFNLMEFFRDYTGSITGDEHAAAPELTGHNAGTIYAAGTLVELAQELAEVCLFAY
jgi:hypothetical protein